MKSVLLILIILFPAAALAQESSPMLDSLRWLAGCWEGTYSNGRTVTEQWMKPLGEMMMGMSRTVKHGKTVEYENVRIVRSDDGSIRYIANPSRQQQAFFTLVDIGEHAAVFENLEHDFPQRIIYELVAADSLVARIEGTIEGKTKSSSFPYRRTPCH